MSGGSPIDRIIDASGLRCTVCDAPMGTCDCWTKCRCGKSLRKGASCDNPQHVVEAAFAEYGRDAARNVVFRMRDTYPEPMKFASGGFRKTLEAEVARQVRAALEDWDQGARAALDAIRDRTP